MVLKKIDVKRFSVKNIIPIAIFTLLSLFSIYKLITTQPKLYGDGTEYLFMQEAIRNHFSPDIQIQDLQSAQEILNEAGFKHENRYLKGLQGFVSKKHQPMKQYWGVFTSKDQKYYCYHFWFYSAVTAPFAEILSLFNLYQLNSFQLVNYLIILFVVFYALFFSKLDSIKKIAASLFFILSGILWYAKLSHPEVFSASFIFISLLFIQQRRYGWSIFFCGIAALQNLPLVLFAPFIFIAYLSFEKFQVKYFIWYGAISIISIIPLLFYYYHFNVISLISYGNLLSHDYVSLKRFSSVFFDLNQGMIVNIPVMLLIFIIAFLLNIRKRKNAYSFNNFILFIVLLISYPCIQQHNWNSGGLRYVSWISMFIVAWLVFEIDWNKKYNKTVLLPIIVILQLTYIISEPNRKSVKFNRLSNWVFNHCPSLYNPVPEIFGERVLNHEVSVFTRLTDTYYYKDKKGIIRKISVHLDSLSTLSISPIYDGIIAQAKFKSKIIEGRTYINIPRNALKSKQYSLSCSCEKSSNNKEYIISDKKEKLMFDLKHATSNNAFDGNMSIAVPPGKTIRLGKRGHAS